LLHTYPPVRGRLKTKKPPTKIIASGNPLRALQNMKTLPLTGFKTGIALANDVHFAFSADNLAVAVSFFCSFQG